METGLTARQIYMKEYMRKKRLDPEFREKQREYDRKRRENPEVREKQREHARKQWEDPEKREKKKEYDRKRRETPEFKKKRKTYRNKPDVKEQEREYRKEYNQTPNRKKSNTKSSWKQSGMLFTEEDFERIYNLYVTQELCNACDCVLTRGERYTTPSKACCDHDHETGLFRHIICNACNVNDRWMKYFC